MQWKWSIYIIFLDAPLLIGIGKELRYFRINEYLFILVSECNGEVFYALWYDAIQGNIFRVVLPKITKNNSHISWNVGARKTYFYWCRQGASRLARFLLFIITLVTFFWAKRCGLFIRKWLYCIGTEQSYYTWLLPFSIFHTIFHSDSLI